MVAQVSPSGDTSGSIPPPPSPEALLVGTVVSSAPRLDPVSEVEEKSSLASCSVVDGTSQVEGVANLSEVEEEVDINQGSQKYETGSSEEKDQHSGFEVTETEKAEQSPDVELVENLHGPTVSSSVDGEPVIDKQNPLTADASAVSAELTPDETAQAEKQQEEIPDAANTTGEEDSGDNDAVAPPHPPGSPDIVSTPDFTEGVDMSLDLEAELRAAMEGLDDLADIEESGDKQTSPELEPW